MRIAMIVALAVVAVGGFVIYSITKSTPWGSSLPEEPSSNSTTPVPDENAYLIGTFRSEQDGEEKRSYEINKPLTTIFYFGNPFVEVPWGLPVRIVVSEINSGSVIDNTTIFTEAEQDLMLATYTFTPSDYGKYKVAANATYGGISSEYSLVHKVVPGPKYTFEVEGKTSAATVDAPAEFDIRSVNFDAKAKKLSIEIEKQEFTQRLQVIVPYELLGDPYGVLLDDEPVKMGNLYEAGEIRMGYTDAIFQINVDETVSHVDIIGTTAIPEFGFGMAALVIAVSMTCVALVASRFYI
jgi:hypothetical protein